jgi:hypothetical protein
LALALKPLSEKQVLQSAAQTIIQKIKKQNNNVVVHLITVNLDPRAGLHCFTFKWVACTAK